MHAAQIDWSFAKTWKEDVRNVDASLKACEPWLKNQSSIRWPFHTIPMFNPLWLHSSQAPAGHSRTENPTSTSTSIGERMPHSGLSNDIARCSISWDTPHYWKCYATIIHDRLECLEYCIRFVQLHLRCLLRSTLEAISKYGPPIPTN